MSTIHVADIIDELGHRTSFLARATLSLSETAQNGVPLGEEEFLGMWYVVEDIKELVKKLEKACDKA